MRRRIITYSTLFGIHIILFPIFSNLQAQSCYTVFESQSGYNMYDDDYLDTVACQVKSMVDNSFAVLGADLYPMLAYMNPTSGYDDAYDEIVQRVDQAYSSYILIVKEFDKNRELRYRMAIKWGDHAAFSAFSDIEKQTILNLLHTKVAAEYESYNLGFVINFRVETAVLQQFMKYLEDGVDADYFETAGFEHINFEVNPINVGFDGNEYLNDDVFDYAGIIDSATGSYVRDDAQLAVNQSSFSTKLILTGPSSDQNIALNQFNDLSDELVMWIHFSSSSRALYKLKTNLTAQQAKQYIDDQYDLVLDELRALASDTTGDPPTVIGSDSRAGMSNDACFDSACDGFFHLGIWPDIDRIRKWSLYCCELPILFDFDFIGGQSFGVIDGLVKTLFFLYDMGSGLHEVMNHNPFSITWWTDAIKRGYNEGNYRQAFEDKFGETKEYWKGIKNTISTIFKNLSWDPIKTMVIKGIKDFLDLLNPLDGGLKSTGYAVGIIAFEVILTYLTGGGAQLKKLTQIPKVVWDKLRQLSSPSEFRTMVAQGLKYSTDKVGKLTCRILNLGCFVKNTPVLMASNSFAKLGKTYALAAAMPFMAIPIQEVPLLSWTVAHETVNERDNLIASTDEDLYLGLIGEDPYTSNQQRQRDKYELNDTDWHSVSFEQVNGTSKCHFALHADWIQQQGYEAEKIVILNLPEQGINGAFRVTAIKHIIPQKKPESDPGDGYDWKPVTGLFEHQSNQVYNISFDNGEELGVTYQHPIFSTTANDWKLAGELEIGEEVLTKSGNTKVVSSTKKDGSETVYNLEVKELHNFLVGESGIVVHNFYLLKNCLNALIDYLKVGAKYVLNGTGKYKNVKGHHPMSKKAFEGNSKYNYNEAFSVSKETLGGQSVHNAITGKQNSLYTAWKNVNPNKTMTLDDMAKIEIQAMKEAGIPEDVATGWVVKALEDLKAQGTEKLNNIPWNGVNP